MPQKKTKPAPHSSAADTSQAVDAFMGTLEHRHKSGIEQIRRAILAADSSIAEGIKWNAPSFRTTEYFATVNLREKSGVGVILHLGAKVRDVGPQGVGIRDPEQLLRWLAQDRAMIVFADAREFEDKRDAFIDVVRQWIVHV